MYGIIEVMLTACVYVHLIYMYNIIYIYIGRRGTVKGIAQDCLPHRQCCKYIYLPYKYVVNTLVNYNTGTLISPD